MCVIADALDWIISRSVWAPWKWPELLTEARETEDLAAAASAWRTPQLLLIHILKVNASTEPGGLTSWGCTYREGLCCVYKCSLANSWERPSSLSTLLVPMSTLPIVRQVVHFWAQSSEREAKEDFSGEERIEVAMCAPGRHPPPSSNIPGSSLHADFQLLFPECTQTAWFVCLFNTMV